MLAANGNARSPAERGHMHVQADRAGELQLSGRARRVAQPRQTVAAARVKSGTSVVATSRRYWMNEFVATPTAQASVRPGTIAAPNSSLNFAGVLPLPSIFQLPDCSVSARVTCWQCEPGQRDG